MEEKRNFALVILLGICRNSTLEAFENLLNKLSEALVWVLQGPGIGRHRMLLCSVACQDKGWIRSVVQGYQGRMEEGGVSDLDFP